ncbi:MAG: hypothetical protein O4965_18435 [Trichodesmium sp. St19_bin1]|nr:hypothetical protein [Trichodesmium sp. St19_bin1]
MGQSISKIGQKMPRAYRQTPVDLKVPSPLVEAGIEQQACLGLYRFHEAAKIAKVVVRKSRIFISKNSFRP